jgi:hypothetical protein
MKRPPSDFDRDFQRMETELKRLEAEYTMFFSGRLPRPPVETRRRVETLVRQYDRTHIQNTGDRFRFQTLQARYSTLVDLWDRGLRAREEGRPGPFNAPRPTAGADRDRGERVVHEAAFRDPVTETEKLHELYKSVADARREAGADPVSFQKFAELVKTQVTRFQASGSGEVAFRVAVKDGKVSLTAKARKSDA